MWKTVLFLLITIVVVPVLAFTFDEPLNPEQKEVLYILLIIYISVAILCFITSSISKNYSQVDKLWSVLPLVYVWIICVKSGFEPRLVLMASLVTLWGVRLSYNFSRRGGYSWKFWTGEEDYRWPVLRNKPEFSAPWKWMLFNLLFISFYQLGLLLLITLPALKSLSGKPVSWIDYLLGGLVILFVAMETVADQQQWNFHKEKKRLTANGGNLPERYRNGFVHDGLWGFMRHPNYTAEQAIWIVIYFFSVTATGRWLNWSVIGAVLLVLLFFGSSNFSESISKTKYPEYHAYRKRVPRFVPFAKGKI